MKHDGSIMAVTHAIREVGREQGNGASFNLFQSLAGTMGSEFQALVYDNLVNGVGVGMVTVRVEKIGDKKIHQIKNVRAATGMSLKDAKDFVELVEGYEAQGIAAKGPQMLNIDGMEVARKFVDDVRDNGGFACIVP